MRKKLKLALPRKYISLILLIAGAVIIYQVSKYIIARKNAYYIGVVLPLRGEDKAMGQNLLKTLEFFRQEINKKEKLSKNIRFIVKNESKDPAIARKEAESLVKNKRVLGVIGYFYSKNLEKVADIYKKGRLPVITLCANSKIVGKNPWIFSMVAKDSEQTAFMAVYLKEILKKKKITVLYEEDVYGKGLFETFKEKAERIGLDIDRKISVNLKLFQASKIIGPKFPTKDKDKEPEAIVLFCSNKKNTIDIIKQLRTNNFNGPIWAPGAFHAGRSANELGFNEKDKFLQNVFVTSYSVSELSNSKVARLAEKLKKKYGLTPYRDTPFCYEAAQFFSFAIMNAGNDREKIRKSLVSVNKKNPLNLLSGFSYFTEDGFKNNNIYVLKTSDGWLKPTFIQLHKLEGSSSDYNKILAVDGTRYCIIDIVYVGIDFFRINDIDTKNMNFDAELFMWYKWKGKDVNISEIEIINGLYDVTDKTTLIMKDMSRPVKYVCYRIKGTFLKPFDLTEFPFDTQELPIIVAHRTKNSNNIMLIIDKKHNNSPLEQIFPREWKYLDRKDNSAICEYNSSFGIPGWEISSNAKYFSAVESIIMLKRIPTTYVLTIFVPLFIIIAIATILFFVPIDRFDTKLSTAMTALLSLVVFQMSARSSLPHVGYLLKSDISFFIGYVLIFTSIINIVVLHVLLKNSREKLAKTLNIVFCLVFLIFTFTIYSCLSLF